MFVLTRIFFFMVIEFLHFVATCTQGVDFTVSQEAERDLEAALAAKKFACFHDICDVHTALMRCKEG